MKKDAKIYVAGHTGLVGLAITKTLRNKGYTNLLLKDISEMDLTNQKEVQEFFAAEKPEYVILAAAKVGGIVANNVYRGEFIYENLMIQNNVIHNAYVHGVKKLLFLGSTCIYPKESPQPMKESYLLTSQLETTNEPYAIAKIAGLKLCESYNRQYGTNFIAVMPTNLYGPKDNFDLEKSHVLPALLRKIHLGMCLEKGDWDGIRRDLNALPIEGVSGAQSEEEILEKLGKYGVRQAGGAGSRVPGAGKEIAQIEVEIWGSGKPMRELMYSEEMAAACVYLMENVDVAEIDALTAKSKEHRAKGSSFAKASEDERPIHFLNIGTGEEISIKELAELIKEIVGFQGALVFNTEKPDGTMRKLTDPGLLHSLGYHHKIGLSEGIGLMYEAYLAR